MRQGHILWYRQYICKVFEGDISCVFYVSVFAFMKFFLDLKSNLFCTWKNPANKRIAYL